MFSPYPINPSSAYPIGPSLCAVKSPLGLSNQPPLPPLVMSNQSLLGLCPSLCQINPTWPVQSIPPFDGYPSKSIHIHERPAGSPSFVSHTHTPQQLKKSPYSEVITLVRNCWGLSNQDGWLHLLDVVSFCISNRFMHLHAQRVQSNVH